MADTNVGDEVEIWKPVPEYEGYEASSKGQVRSWRNNRAGLRSVPRIMQGKVFHGYRRMCISYNRKPKWVFAHTLVLLAHKGPPPDKSRRCCGHWNGVRSDNRLENLRWVSYKENTEDRDRHGTSVYLYGESHPSAKLTDRDVVEIRRRHRNGNGAPLAREFGVARKTIRLIVKRITWTHI